MTCYNKICDGVANLTGKSFTPSHVHDNPSSIQVASCGRARISLRDPLPTTHLLQKRHLGIREIY